MWSLHYLAVSLKHTSDYPFLIPSSVFVPPVPKALRYTFGNKYLRGLQLERSTRFSTVIRSVSPPCFLSFSLSFSTVRIYIISHPSFSTFHFLPPFFFLPVVWKWCLLKTNIPELHLVVLFLKGGRKKKSFSNDVRSSAVWGMRGTDEVQKREWWKDGKMELIEGVRKAGRQTRGMKRETLSGY